MMMLKPVELSDCGLSPVCEIENVFGLTLDQRDERIRQELAKRKEAMNERYLCHEKNFVRRLDGNDAKYKPSARTSGVTVVAIRKKVVMA